MVLLFLLRRRSKWLWVIGIAVISFHLHFLIFMNKIYMIYMRHHRDTCQKFQLNPGYNLENASVFHSLVSSPRSWHQSWHRFRVSSWPLLPPLPISQLGNYLSSSTVLCTSELSHFKPLLTHFHKDGQSTHCFQSTECIFLSVGTPCFSHSEPRHG